MHEAMWELRKVRIPGRFSKQGRNAQNLEYCTLERGALGIGLVFGDYRGDMGCMVDG